jgi:hypothetical protein
MKLLPKLTERQRQRQAEIGRESEGETERGIEIVEGVFFVNDGLLLFGFDNLLESDYSLIYFEGLC